MSDIAPAYGASIAIDAAGGYAWVAQNTDLLRVSIADKSVTDFPIDVTTDNPTMEAFRPALIRGRHAAVAVAVAPDSQSIAVAVNASSGVFVFHTATQEFSELNLPTANDATGVAYLPDGRLVVGLANYSTGHTEQVLVYAPDLSTSRALSVDDSSTITTGSAGDIISGNDDPSLISSDLVVSPVSPTMTAQTGGLPESVVQRADGSLVAAGKLGLASTTSTAAAQTIAYPTEQCPSAMPTPPVASADATTTTQPRMIQCVVRPVALTTDGAGNVWAELSMQSGPTLAVIRATS